MNVVRIRQRATRVVLTYLTIALLFLSTPVSLNACCCFDGVNCDECPQAARACVGTWNTNMTRDSGAGPGGAHTVSLLSGAILGHLAIITA
jgi:hypothetical protein